MRQCARKEHMVGLYLDAQNGLIHLALGFILAHNRPSGCLGPSDEDVELTRAVRRAGAMMGIEPYDHIIVAGEGS